MYLSDPWVPLFAMALVRYAVCLVSLLCLGYGSHIVLLLMECVCAAKMFGSIACEGEVHALWATTEWEANSCRNFCAHVMP